MDHNTDEFRDWKNYILEANKKLEDDALHLKRIANYVEKETPNEKYAKSLNEISYRMIFLSKYLPKFLKIIE